MCFGKIRFVHKRKGLAACKTCMVWMHMLAEENVKIAFCMKRYYGEEERYRG